MFLVKFLELWCLNNHGIPLFYHNPETIQDADNIESLDSAQLISGLFSAIQTMAESTLNEDVTLIELNKSKLVFNKKEGITVIARVKLTERKTNVKTVLRKITDNFIHDFKDILDDWMGNTLIFDKFKEHVSEYWGNDSK